MQLAVNILDYTWKTVGYLFPVAKAVASNVNKHIPSFSDVRKFQSDFQSLDNACTVPWTASMTDSQSVTDESIDRLQSDYDHLQSASTSDAEEADITREKLPRRRRTNLKSDLVPSAVTDKEW